MPSNLTKYMDKLKSLLTHAHKQLVGLELRCYFSYLKKKLLKLNANLVLTAEDQNTRSTISDSQINIINY